MKRFFGFLMLVLFSFSVLTGCGSSGSTPDSNSEGSSESSLESNSDNNSDRKWSVFNNGKFQLSEVQFGE